MSESEKLAPAWVAAGWTTFKVEGAVYGAGSRIVIERAEVTGIRKTFLIQGKGPQATAAERRPGNYASLPPSEQWSIDKRLGILDWDGSPET